MVACYNGVCFRPTEPDLKLPDCRVSSWARIGADWQRPVWKLPLRLSSNHLAAAGTLKVVPGTSLGVDRWKFVYAHEH